MIMDHVTLPLPGEALERGSVYIRWMYTIERYLETLKHFVINRAKQEGSIDEAYVVEEALVFVERYFESALNEVVHAHELFVF